MATNSNDTNAQEADVPQHPLTTEEITQGLSNLGRTADGSKLAYLNLVASSLAISDIVAIKPFFHVQTVDVSHNGLNDLTPLGSLPNLTSVNASHNKLTRILDFKAPLNLREADLSHNEIESMNDVGQHRFLVQLNLDNNKIHKIAGINSLQCLKVLKLNCNAIRQIGGIDNLPLRDLGLASNQLECITNTETLTDLQHLDLSTNDISSLRGAEHIGMLRTLNVGSNNVRHLEEIEHLQNLPLLTALSLQDNPVTEIPCFRLNALHLIPGVSTLNGVEVTAEEKVCAANFHDVDHPQYRDTRRDDSVDLPPELFGPAETGATPVAVGES